MNNTFTRLMQLGELGFRQDLQSPVGCYYLEVEGKRIDIPNKLIVHSTPAEWDAELKHITDTIASLKSAKVSEADWRKGVTGND